jgi:uncharacterized membrane protein YdjX (TVP38/TMEM64 family)
VSPSPAGRLARLLLRRHGNFVWDGVLRSSAVLALAGIAVLEFGSPEAAGLVGFAVVTIWVNGPLGFFMPATYEPILMLFGRVYPPVLIGFLGILGILYVEFLNYHLYRRVLQLQALSPARGSRFVQLTVRLFERAPFFTVWLCAWSPLPYWAVRVVAPLAGYPIRRYLFATFLGRFPRLWFFAALGLYWHVGTPVLSAIALGTIGLYVLIWVIRRSGKGNRAAPTPSLDAG